MKEGKRQKSKAESKKSASISRAAQIYFFSRRSQSIFTFVYNIFCKNRKHFFGFNSKKEASVVND